MNQGGYAFSVPKNSAWKHLFSQAVLKLKEQEVIEDIYKKWFPVSCGANNNTNSQYEPVEINYFGGLFFILLLFLAISILLLGGEHFCYRHHRRVINPIQDKVMVWRETKAAERRNAIINPADISYLQQMHISGKLGGAARKSSTKSNQSSESSSEGDISEGEEEMIRMRLGRRNIPRQSTAPSIQRTSLDSLGQYYSMFNGSHQQQQQQQQHQQQHNQQHRGSKIDALLQAKKLNFDPELSTTFELNEADAGERSSSVSTRDSSEDESDHNDIGSSSPVFPFQTEYFSGKSLQHLQRHLHHLYHQSQTTNSSQESINDVRERNNLNRIYDQSKSINSTSHRRFSKEEEHVGNHSKEEFNDSGMDYSLGSGGDISSKDGTEPSSNDDFSKTNNPSRLVNNKRETDSGYAETNSRHNSCNGEPSNNPYTPTDKSSTLDNAGHVSIQISDSDDESEIEDCVNIKKNSNSGRKISENSVLSKDSLTRKISGESIHSKECPSRKISRESVSSKDFLPKNFARSANNRYSRFSLENHENYKTSIRAKTNPNQTLVNGTSKLSSSLKETDENVKHREDERILEDNTKNNCKENRTSENKNEENNGIFMTSRLQDGEHKQAIIIGKKRSRRKTVGVKPSHSIVDIPDICDNNNNNKNNNNNNNNITNSFVIQTPSSQQQGLLTTSLSCEQQESSLSPTAVTNDGIFYRKTTTGRRGTVPL